MPDAWRKALGALFALIYLNAASDRHPMSTRTIHLLWIALGYQRQLPSEAFIFYIPVVPICIGPRNGPHVDQICSSAHK